MARFFSRDTLYRIWIERDGDSRTAQERIADESTVPFGVDYSGSVADVLVPFVRDMPLRHESGVSADSVIIVAGHDVDGKDVVFVFFRVPGRIGYCAKYTHEKSWESCTVDAMPRDVFFCDSLMLKRPEIG